MDHRMGAYAYILCLGDKNLRFWINFDTRIPHDYRISCWHIRVYAFPLFHRISPYKNIRGLLHRLDPPSRIICLSLGRIIRNAGRTPICARMLGHPQYSGNRIQTTMVAFSTPPYWLSPTNRGVFWRRLKIRSRTNGSSVPATRCRVR